MQPLWEQTQNNLYPLYIVFQQCHHSLSHTRGQISQAVVIAITTWMKPLQSIYATGSQKSINVPASSLKGALFRANCTEQKRCKSVLLKKKLPKLVMSIEPAVLSFIGLSKPWHLCVCVCHVHILCFWFPLLYRSSLSASTLKASCFSALPI